MEQKLLFELSTQIRLLDGKVRDGCLLELMNISNEQLEYVKMFIVSKNYKIFYITKTEINKKILIAKQDIIDEYIWHKNLGKVLGFYCGNDDFHNMFVDRVSVSFSMKYDNMISRIAFVCPIDNINISELYSYMEDMKNKMVIVLPEYKIGLEVRIVDSILKRYNAITENNKVYIHKNIQDYINDSYLLPLQGKEIRDSLKELNNMENLKILYLKLMEKIKIKYG